MLGPLSSQALSFELQILWLIKDLAVFLAFKLHSKNFDTFSRESLSICKRIYLDFDGSCYCNSRSTICDTTTHICQNCTFGAVGFQCEKCPVDMRFDKSGKCVNGIEECFCNNHSLECIDGVCQDCDNNTVGENCELCDVGYYGDPAKGNGCVKCPCP